MSTLVFAPPIATLSSLWRYPIKSMMGEEINAASITTHGLFGDRAMALVDSETGKVASAKNPRKWPTFFSYRAAYTFPPDLAAPLPPARVTLPNGSTILTSDTDFNAAISASLGRPVTLISSAPKTAQLEEYWPDMEGLAHRDHVTDEALPEGTFFDLALLHILTTSTIDALRAAYPQGRFEPRRFRPNLILDTTGLSGFVENSWIGRTLSIGDNVLLKITGPCPRCVMTTLPQGDLPKDPGILKTAATHNNVQVGVYATVLLPGPITRGDAVALHD
jgi:uncharacterized protein YcbX